MKRTLLALVVTLVCAAVPATAGPIAFVGFLNGGNEEPPNPSLGTGTAFVVIDPVTHTLRVQVTFGGLVDLVTASHIHVINGPNDANLLDTLGPVATTTPSFTGFPTGVTAGAYDQTFSTLVVSTFSSGFLSASGGTVDGAEAALLAALIEGRAYLNIHTRTYPGGEIRDFLEPAAPEPATLALLMLGAVGVVRRRRQAR